MLFALLAWPTRWAETYVLREVYRTGMATGVLPAGGPLGGQVRGLNYPRLGGAARATVLITTQAIAWTPALVLALLLFDRARGRDVRTRCGRCDRALMNLAAPQCPWCNERL